MISIIHYIGYGFICILWAMLIKESLEQRFHLKWFESLVIISLAAAMLITTLLQVIKLGIGFYLWYWYPINWGLALTINYLMCKLVKLRYENQ